MLEAGTFGVAQSRRRAFMWAAAPGDPQPMGKVGMCFHPERDTSVLKCVRSHGFPDSYQFGGTIQSKHWQIGRVEPPPLASALGRKVKEAIDAKRHHTQLCPGEASRDDQQILCCCCSKLLLLLSTSSGRDLA